MEVEKADEEGREGESLARAKITQSAPHLYARSPRPRLGPSWYQRPRQLWRKHDEELSHPGSPARSKMASLSPNKKVHNDRIFIKKGSRSGREAGRVEGVRRTKMPFP